jgi:hypothetical protein
MNVCLMKTQFSDGRTNTQHSQWFRASSSGDPPSPPMKPGEALLTAQTEVLHQLLQTLQ